MDGVTVVLCSCSPLPSPPGPAVRQASFSSALLGIADARRPPSVAGQDDDANHAGSSSVVGENAVLRERGRGVEGFDDFEAIRVGAPDLRAERYVFAEVDAEVKRRSKWCRLSGVRVYNAKPGDELCTDRMTVWARLLT